MTREQYNKSLCRHCGILGIELPSPSMVAAYYTHGYSPRDAASIELDEYIQFKRALREETRRAEKANL